MTHDDPTDPAPRRAGRCSPAWRPPPEGSPSPVQVHPDWTRAVETAGGTGDSAWIVTSRTDDGLLHGDYDGFRILYPSPVAAVLTAHAVEQAAKPKLKPKPVPAG